LNGETIDVKTGSRLLRLDARCRCQDEHKRGSTGRIKKVTRHQFSWFS
jgi:hypothetical protein